MSPIGYTKQNVEIEIEVKPKEIKITNIEVPSEITKNEQGKYEASKNGTYLIKVTLENGEKLEKEIKIETIDKLPPKPFTIAVNTTETSVIISGETTDEEATNENASSGIDRYEYIVMDEAGTETTYNTNEITGLEPGKYTVYAVAYDKAGNSSEKNNEITVKINYYEWKKYSSKYVYGYSYESVYWIPYKVVGDLSVMWNPNYISNYFNEQTGEFELNKDYDLGENSIKLKVSSKAAFWVVGDRSKIYITKKDISRPSTKEAWSIWCTDVYIADKTKSYKKGDQYLGIVNSTNSEEYPQNGYKDGYWYEKID